LKHFKKVNISIFYESHSSLFQLVLVISEHQVKLNVFLATGWNKIYFCTFYFI